MTGGTYPSSPHWVQIDNEEIANEGRVSIVRFTHFRPRVKVRVLGPYSTPELEKEFPATYAGVLLANRLREIGYIQDPLAHKRMVENVVLSLPDEVAVNRILRWEAKQKEQHHKLLRYQ